MAGSRVGGTDVAVGGTDVAVAVGGTEVAVAGTGVAVGERRRRRRVAWLSAPQRPAGSSDGTPPPLQALAGAGRNATFSIFGGAAWGSPRATFSISGVYSGEPRGRGSRWISS